MPYTVGKYFQAFADALSDDLRLLQAAAEINDQNPLGTAAGYGTSLKIDRDLTTRLLGFGRTQENDLYAQNSRGKFESIILGALSQVMLDLQRLAHDLILYSMDEFGYFRLPEEFATGSSIMPQKKNPDVLELVRAKFAVVHACYFQIMEILKGLPSGYHRDLQLTKEPLMRGLDETLSSVRIMGLVLGALIVDAEKCRTPARTRSTPRTRPWPWRKRGSPSGTPTGRSPKSSDPALKALFVDYPWPVASFPSDGLLL